MRWLTFLLLGVASLAAIVATALAVNGETVAIDSTQLIYTGPNVGAAQVRLAENPTNGSQVVVTSATTMQTDAPECGGPGLSSTTITCIDQASRRLSVTTFTGSDRIDIGGGRSARVRSGPGADFVSSGSGADDLDGEAGDDVVFGGAGADALTGGDGSDRLYGGTSSDALSGGAGRDTLMGGPGADALVGGDGSDEADYSERGSSAPVTVALDDAANDGETGELDNVASDVEDLRGGAGGDHLTGNAASNSLTGGDGNDALDGGGGVDFYDAGAGDDTVTSRDGIAERVDCGAGADVATTDEIDVIVGCETNNASRELQPGGSAPPPPSPPPPPAAPARITATVAAAFSVSAGRTRVTKLQVKFVPAGAAVEIRCAAKGCPFKQRSRSFTAAAASRSFLSLFKKRRLRPAGTIEVRVTAPGTIGKLVRYTLRKHKKPASKTLCLPPGSRPASC